MAFDIPAGADPINYIPPASTAAAGLPPVNSAPASALGTNTQTYSSYYPTPTASTGLATTALASKDAILAKNAAEADALQAAQPAQQGAIANLLSRIGTSATGKVNAEEAAGLPDQQKEIDELTSQMESRGKAYDDQITQLQSTNPNGELASGVSGDVGRLNRDKASELANIAIVLNAKTRNFTTAKSIVDAKADAETEDLKTQLQGLQYFADQNASTLSKDQQSILSDKIDAADKEYQDAKETRTAVGNVQLAAAQNGAPLGVITAIGKSADREGAIKAAGPYLQNQTKTPGTFTTTQVNGGAANAGLKITDFDTLPPDDQNYFINTYTGAGGFLSAVSAVKNGTATASDLSDAINSAPISDRARDILRAQAKAQGADTAPAGPGIFSRAWSFLTN